MKNFYHILAAIAFATVAMFSAQTAKAQSTSDNEKHLSTIEIVHPNGSITRITCDFGALWSEVLTNPTYKDTILGIVAQNGTASYIDVYNAFMEAGLKEETCWILSEIYKVRPHFFDPFEPILKQY